VTGTHRDWVLLLLFVATFSALWPRYQAYRLHREVLEKAKLCRENVKGIGLAAMMYATDNGNHYPDRIGKLLPEMPLCPFDGSAYQGLPTVLTHENEGYFPHGIAEHSQGDFGYIVRCNSKVHQRSEPDLKPGYVLDGFGQAKTALIRTAEQ
jgi:hypothetical protein